MERDPDLEAFYQSADRVGPNGVRALIDRMQEYRNSAREACNVVARIATASEQETNVTKLRASIAGVDNVLANWQWQAELDHLEFTDFLK